MIEPRPVIAAMAAYALPDTTAPEGVEPVILAQNEHAFAPTAAVRAAVDAALASGQLYPDSEWTNLRAAIAAVHDLDPARILCGCGSMELMSALVNAYIGAGDRVAMTEYGYLFMRTLVKMVDAGLNVAPERDFQVDVDALLDAVDADTRLVFVVNPGNPSGTVIANDEIRRLRRALTDDVLLLVDEAYSEFVEPGFNAPLFDLVDAGNTVITRTFSKIYGLAGLRVGWGYFPPEMIVNLRKVMTPGGLSQLSQAAAAAAMRDQQTASRARAEIARLRELLSRGIAALGLRVIPSQTNFVLVDLNSPERAAAAYDFLRSRGLIVRPMGGYGLPHCLRISIAEEPHMRATVDALAAWQA
ncbi:MAG: histidinol-phosphate transaminase [Gammaproteobacteria bacterium]|nr:histidinol-phosphate transaminase [Gammaproteobacteria bacterium]